MQRKANNGVNSTDNSNFAKYHRTFTQSVLRPHQRLWLEAILRGNTFILGARQIGKSFLVAYAALLLAAGYEGDGISLPPTDVTVISADRAKAVNIIKAVNIHLKALGLAVDDITHDTQGGLQSAVLRNGKTIQAVSGLSKSLQGYAGHVIVDELSLTEADPEEIWSQVFAVTSSREYLRAIVCTNADTAGSWVDNFSNNMSQYWKGRRRGWQTFNTNIWDVYPTLTPKLEQVRSSCSAETWQRFFENRFVSGQSRLFDDKKFVHSDFGTGPVWVSCDPGFSATGNPSGVIVAQVDGDSVHVLRSERWWACPESEQVERLKSLVQDNNATRLLVDIGSAGLAMAQKLDRVTNLTKVSVSGKMFQQGFLRVKNLIEDGKLTFSDDCWDLKEDLLSIEIKASGQYHAPQIPHKSGGKLHADIAYALMYIVHNLEAAKEEHEMQILDVGNFLDRQFSAGLSWDRL